MSEWAGLAVEVEGVEKVASRDFTDEELARYVYGRASDYMGANHEAVTVELIAAALRGRAREGE